MALCATALLSGPVRAQQPVDLEPRGIPAATSPIADVETQPAAGPPPPSQPPSADPAIKKLGPTPVDEVQILEDLLRNLCDRKALFDPRTQEDNKSALKIYGWVDGGYTYASGGPGRLSVQPRPNYLGDEFTLNQLSITLDKPTDPKELSFGFLIEPYAGSDAALLAPVRGTIIPNANPRFGFDFLSLYLRAHLPVFTEDGVDVTFGQHYPPIGYEAAPAPLRTFYSNGYQWYYGTPAPFTGVLVTTHVTKQLDVLNGVTLGYNEFFTNLSVAPNYLGRIDYWLEEDRKTKLSLGVTTGPVHAHANVDTTLVLLTFTRNWDPRLTQVVQFSACYSKEGIFVPGLERAYGLYNQFSYHVDPTWDVNIRTEWYDDVDGRGYPGGTGFKTNYEEVTLGIDYHPKNWLQLRPELRGDLANDARAFGPQGSPRNHSQLTAAMECLIKF